MPRTWRGIGRVSALRTCTKREFADDLGSQRMWRLTWSRCLPARLVLLPRCYVSVRAIGLTDLANPIRSRGQVDWPSFQAVRIAHERAPQEVGVQPGVEISHETQMRAPAGTGVVVRHQLERVLPRVQLVAVSGVVDTPRMSR